MDTLLLRLQAPMQSWGISSHFTVRDTCREPSKSGVIGLVCAALGRARSEPVEDLARLKMGVRVDREGKLERDYHIAQEIFKAGGGIKKSETSNRYYLADAVFLVGLEGDSQLLAEIEAALKNPCWCLYLGRKAFPPSKPVWLQGGLRKGEDLYQALRTFPRLAHTDAQRLRIAVDDPEGDFSRGDVPLSFSERRFASRPLQMEYIDAPEEVLEEETHDIVETGA